MAGTGETLLPTSETTAPEAAAKPEPAPEEEEEDREKKSYNADSVFASLKDVKIEDESEE